MNTVTQPESARWLLRVKSNPQARLRLFCFPYSGGGASAFASWGQSLPASIAVCPVQLPGRESRIAEPPFVSMDALVPCVAEALRPLLNPPYALFGHSLGALVAFEVARYLRALGAPPPANLFVSACRAPHGSFPEPTYELPEAEFLGRIRRLKGTPNAVFENPELLELVLPILRADTTIYDTYRFQPGDPIECPITALGGVADDHVSRADLADWSIHTKAAFRLRMFPGDHFFLQSARPQLLRALATDLETILHGPGWSSIPTSNNHLEEMS